MAVTDARVGAPARPGLPHDVPRTLAFLRGLLRDNGLYADGPEAPQGDVRSTLSVIKAMLALGTDVPEPQALREVILDARNADGGFGPTPGSPSTPLDTAAACISLHALGTPELHDTLTSAATFSTSNATSQFDHFMTIALCDECGLAMPRRSVDFFTDRLPTARADGRIVDLGIALSALLRAGEPPDDATQTALHLVSTQNADGGFGDDNTSTLFGTYCVMRALVLAGCSPNTEQMLGYLEALRTHLGWHAGSDSATAAGAIYQVTGIAEWLRQLQRLPIAAARAGEVEALRTWLRAGGVPDLAADDGWTPLTAAAARGRVQVVDYLLGPEAGLLAASPLIRFEPADLLPLHLAAQAGSLETVQLLLQHSPALVRSTCAVNGHTVLLQAAFYGTSGHQAIARWLLEHASELTGVPDTSSARWLLLEATNVRGYNALSMQDLWHNEPMRALLASYLPGRIAELTARSARYTAELLRQLASPAQSSIDLLRVLDDYILNDAPDGLAAIKAAITSPQLDLNALTGPLGMTPLIHACTGVDVGESQRALRRRTAVELLLQAGADPTVCEAHPMAVGAVIRASVLNNLGLLQLIAEYMAPDAFAAEMNKPPAINGLTAMHDAVHRALTSPTDELHVHTDQIRWMIEHGASIDIENHAGLTQRELALRARSDAAFDAATVTQVLAAMAIPADQPTPEGTS